MKVFLNTTSGIRGPHRGIRFRGQGGGAPQIKWGNLSWQGFLNKVSQCRSQGYTPTDHLFFFARIADEVYLSLPPLINVPSGAWSRKETILSLKQQVEDAGNFGNLLKFMYEVLDKGMWGRDRVPFLENTEMSLRTLEKRESYSQEVLQNILEGDLKLFGQLLATIMVQTRVDEGELYALVNDNFSTYITKNRERDYASARLSPQNYHILLAGAYSLKLLKEVSNAIHLDPQHKLARTIAAERAAYLEGSFTDRLIAIIDKTSISGINVPLGTLALVWKGIADPRVSNVVQKQKDKIAEHLQKWPGTDFRATEYLLNSLLEGGIK